MKKLVALKSFFMALAFAGSALVVHAQHDHQSAYDKAIQIVGQLSAANQQALLEGDVSIARTVLEEYGADFEDLTELRNAVAAILRAAGNLQNAEPSPETINNVSLALLRAIIEISQIAEVSLSRSFLLHNASQGLQQGARLLANQWNTPVGPFLGAANAAFTTVVAQIGVPPSDFGIFFGEVGYDGLPPITVDDRSLIVVSPENTP